MGAASMSLGRLVAARTNTLGRIQGGCEDKHPEVYTGEEGGDTVGREDASGVHELRAICGGEDKHPAVNTVGGRANALG
jgi:hypothetical protein